MYGMAFVNRADILMCGGWNGTSHYDDQLSSCVLYVADVNVWIAFQPLPVAIEGLAMLLVQNRPYRVRQNTMRI
jgi:hypothetical protein